MHRGVRPGSGVPRRSANGFLSPSTASRHVPESAGGAGLGLALAKQIAERHGGSLIYLPRERRRKLLPGPASPRGRPRAARPGEVRITFLGVFIRHSVRRQDDFGKADLPMPLSALDELTITALIQEAVDCVPNAVTIFDENLVPNLANKFSHELYTVLHAATQAGKTFREATFLEIKAADPHMPMMNAGNWPTCWKRCSARATPSRCPTAEAGSSAHPIRR